MNETTGGTPEEVEAFSDSLFGYHPLLLAAGIFSAILGLQLVVGLSHLVKLPSSGVSILVLGLLFLGITLASRRFTGIWLRRRGLNFPTVVIWSFPLLTFLFTYIFSFLLLVAWPGHAGRGFWPEFLRLNPKTTTVMFTSSFSGFFLCMLILVIIETIRYVQWSVGLAVRFSWGEDPAGAVSGKNPPPPGSEATPPETEKARSGAEDQFQKVRAKLDAFHALRAQSSRFTRRALGAVFLLLVGVSSWIIFLKPETILFYRSEVQLQTRQHPEIAFETLNHLAQKYPDYKYLDTVKFRAAWTLDRRMGDYPGAVKRFEGFLGEFGYENVWTDDVLTNLVRLQLDKCHNATESLKWAEIYGEKFPNGLMAPQIALYRIRALSETGRTDAAKDALAKAREQFGGAVMNIYDNEDDFVSTLTFADALRSLNLD